MCWKEKNFEEKMSMYIDDIYKKLFKEKLLEIYRSNRNTEIDEKILFMDINMAIDTTIRMTNGSILTFQEKTRKYKFKNYNDFTFEYYNDPKTKDEGEWFKLAAQLYFYGYANEKEDGYYKYYFLNVTKLRTGLMRKFTILELENNFLKQNKPPAKANFFAIPFQVLSELDGVIIYESKGA
jgi:hypothetical protein